MCENPMIREAELFGGGGCMQDGVDDTEREEDYEEYLSHLSDMAELFCWLGW